MLMRLLVRLAINALALWVADALLDGVVIEGAAAYIIGALVLGIANAVIKPVLAVLTFPLILLTLGFFYLLINIAMLALAEWIAPNFAITGFWTYVATVVVIWGVNWIVGEVLEDLRGGRRGRRIRFT